MSISQNLAKITLHHPKLCTGLHYAPDYTLHHKLFECTFCTLNYHTYHTLHPGVTFFVMFNGMLLHMTSTCILLRWNKLKRLKHPISKSIKTKPNFFHNPFQLFKIFGEKSACFRSLNEQLQQAIHPRVESRKILIAFYRLLHKHGPFQRNGFGRVC